MTTRSPMLHVSPFRLSVSKRLVREIRKHVIDPILLWRIRAGKGGENEQFANCGSRRIEWLACGASMERPEIPGQAAEIFDQFCSAGTLKSILNLHRQLCDILHIRPTHINQFYPKLKELAGGQKLVHPITPFPNTSSTSSWELMENGTPSKVKKHEYNVCIVVVATQVESKNFFRSFLILGSTSLFSIHQYQSSPYLVFQASNARSFEENWPSPSRRISSTAIQRLRPASRKSAESLSSSTRNSSKIYTLQLVSTSRTSCTTKTIRTTSS
ncbi:unnamed protein product [Nesidiocoris tenuis]|uniref:Uncharacterized protein n=1 Tax=Nesidiocoris tenuis TaxID=355587 RepID=A0A6H5G135_9HEMI|nr:unnamed protein product [Nesidiocoris tenuis]